MAPNVEEGDLDIHVRFPQETYYPDCTFLLTCSVLTWLMPPFLKFYQMLLFLMSPQPAFFSSKLTVRTLEQGVKYVQG